MPPGTSGTPWRQPRQLAAAPSWAMPLTAAYQEYAGLLIANAADHAETACASVRDAVGAYQDADLQMAADAQAGMASTR